MNWNKIGLFAGGLLFGTYGLKILGSRDAKSVYAQTVAAGIRCKDTVVADAMRIKEGAQDVYADAKAINAARAGRDAIIEDKAE